MDLERVAIEAVKEKIQDVFNKISVVASMEGKSIVIRIELPDDVMNTTTSPAMPYKLKFNDENKQLVGLDKDAQAAADELLGNQQFIAQE